MAGSKARKDVWPTSQSGSASARRIDQEERLKNVHHPHRIRAVRDRRREAQGPRRHGHRRHARHRRRICHSLALEGAVAAGYGRDRERAEAFQAELSKDEIPVSIHQGNIGSADDCRRTVQEVIDHHGAWTSCQQRRHHL
jgi:hypothetical protein